MATLKGCPFCGGSAKLAKVGHDWWRVSADHDDECALDDDHALMSPQTPEGKSWIEKAWNRRPAAQDGAQ